MILYYLIRSGLFARADGEKFRYFFGVSPNPLYLSRKWPLFTAIDWPRALFSASYAQAVTRWLLYRSELYDGIQG